MKPLSKTCVNAACQVYELMDTDLHQIIRSAQPLSDQHLQYFIYQVRLGDWTRPAGCSMAALGRGHFSASFMCPHTLAWVVPAGASKWGIITVRQRQPTLPNHLDGRLKMLAHSRARKSWQPGGADRMASTT